jgi:hypothetical protein
MPFKIYVSISHNQLWWIYEMVMWERHYTTTEMLRTTGDMLFIAIATTVTTVTKVIRVMYGVRQANFLFYMNMKCHMKKEVSLLHPVLSARIHFKGGCALLYTVCLTSLVWFVAYLVALPFTALSDCKHQMIGLAWIGLAEFIIISQLDWTGYLMSTTYSLNA